MNKHHDHERDDARPLPGSALRTRALESLLIDKGLVNPETPDVLIDAFQTKIDG
jgi:nitrile hydratase